MESLGAGSRPLLSDLVGAGSENLPFSKCAGGAGAAARGPCSESLWAKIELVCVGDRGESRAV